MTMPARKPKKTLFDSITRDWDKERRSRFQSWLIEFGYTLDDPHVYLALGIWMCGEFHQKWNSTISTMRVVFITIAVVSITVAYSIASVYEMGHRAGVQDCYLHSKSCQLP